MQAARTVDRLSSLVEFGHATLSVRRQCELLGVSRSSLDYEPVEVSKEELHLRLILDETYMIDPCLGTRRLVTILERDHGIEVNRKRLQRVRREMGMEAIYCHPRTSIPAPGNQIYPYLLRDVSITEPDHVWCSDITYVPMENGHAYLCAVMDWASRKVLGWSLSNTMDAGLCLAALENAVKNSGRVPKIMNTDQGAQFTGKEWTGRLKELGVAISMDGRRRWLDNVFIERLWRSVKHEEIYLSSPVGIGEQRKRLEVWFERYNTWRPNQALGNKTPGEVYEKRA